MYFAFISSWLDDTPLPPIETSGSTGNEPKPFQPYKEIMIISAQNTIASIQPIDTGKTFICLPIQKIGGLMALTRALVFHWDYKVVEPSLNALKSLSINHDYELVSLTPLQLETILQSAEETIKLNRFTIVLLGGGKVSQGLEKKIAVLKPRFYETYGMTETYSNIALKRIGSDSAFTPIKGWVISSNSEGCLRAKNDIMNIAVESNDVVNILDNNSFEIIGRNDFVINSGGLKIFPEMLEKALWNLNPKLDSALYISSVPDEKLGEKVVLVGMVPLEEVKLEPFALGRNLRPKLYFQLDELPRINHKINRNALKSLLLQQLKDGKRQAQKI